MWDIITLLCKHVCVALCLEDKYKMIQSMKSIEYLSRLTCASWIPRLRTYGFDLEWDMGFELGFTVGMFMGGPVRYPL